MTSMPISKAKQRPAYFQKSELVFLGLIFLAILANIVVDFQGPQDVAWGSFGMGYFGAFGLVLLGSYYRVAYPRVAWVGKAAVVVSLASILGITLGILFHQQMPRPEPVLTEALLAMDHWFGYDWPTAVAWVADIPYLGLFLQLVYFSSFFQIMLLFVVLAAVGRWRDLDIMMFTNGVALILVYVIWQAFPNLSQSTYLPIQTETAHAAALVTDSLYGAALLDMAQNGLPLVTMDAIIGAVAFPSYHMVMCALVVWVARRTALFWPILAINIIMIPAILIHGAHHIADVLGGIAVFAVALLPSSVVVNHCHKDT